MNKVLKSLLFEDIEDCLISMAEEGIVSPNEIVVTYTQVEYDLVEKYHRFRYLPEKKLKGFTKDRWPIIKVHINGIDVAITPEQKVEETIH